MLFDDELIQIQTINYKILSYNPNYYKKIILYISGDKFFITEKFLAPL